MPDESSANFEHLLQQALAHARVNRVLEAIDCYKLILQTDPKHARAQYKLGALLFEVGRTDLAMPYLETAFALNPSSQNVWFVLIKGLVRMGRLHEARSALVEGLQRWGFSGEKATILIGELSFYEQAATGDSKKPVQLPEVTDTAFYEILAKAWSNSMSSSFGFIETFYSLYQNVGYVVDRGIPGDYVECGCYAGGMSLLAALTFLQRGDTSRHLYLFDTFEGMPAPTTEDGAMAGDTYVMNTQTGESWAKVNFDEVRDTMLSSGYPRDKIHVVKGMVEDTIPTSAPENIAILRLDTDFYSSIKHTLTHLYPRVSRGGVVIFDDYGAIVGARRAVDEYFSTVELPMMLHRINYTVRVGIKV